MSRDIASGNSVGHKDISICSYGSGAGDSSGLGVGSGAGYSFGSGSGAGYSTGCGDMGFSRVLETQEYNWDGYGHGCSCGAGSKYYIGIGRAVWQN